jgi:hypothetical protein
MKHLLLNLSLLVLLPTLSTAQIQSHTNPIQPYNIPSFGIARSVAMGGTGVAESHSGVYQFINPALLSDLKGIELGGGRNVGYFQSPNHPTYMAYLGARILKKTFLGGSIVTRSQSYSISPDQISNASSREYSFSIGQNIVQNEKHQLDVGIRFNTHPTKFPGQWTIKGYNFDLGFRYQNNIAERHRLSAGLVLGNLLKGQDKQIYSENQVITTPYSSQIKVGVAYRYETAKKITNRELTLISTIANVEYNDQLSLKYYTTMRAGLELKLAEIISLRAGYYNSKLPNFNEVPGEILKESLFTAGIGVELPFEKLFRKPWPFFIGADYCRTPFPTYNPAFVNFQENYSATYFNFKLVWQKNKAG